jgi:CheY-like chemotaxis protein
VALENAHLYDELREADRRKDEFLAMLAHELRNPLAPIRNAVQFLRMAGPASKDLPWACDVIERQTAQMTRLVDDLLDVSRITRGKIRLEKAPVDVATVVAQAVESSRPVIEARQHALDVALPPGPPLLVDADATRLAQVVLNLLHNAAKYTDEGGKIWVVVERQGDEAAIRVRDTGIGIPPEMLPHVFDLFTQVDRTLDRAQGGLGIGLTLVRRLVELHGGRATASSPGPGQGSEFVIRLPLLDAAPAEHQAAPANSQRTGPRYRILVVDDNRDSADSLAIVLRGEGHEVVTAYDGPSALEEARTSQPQAVLLDIGLPGLDGYEVARRLRQDRDLQHVLLVAMTGYGKSEDRERSRQAGFDAHLVKPVDLDELKSLLSRSAAEAATS